MLSALAAQANANHVGFLQTPSSSGIVSAGSWAPPAGGQGYRVTWDISQNPDDTWHYEYTFTRQDGGSIMPRTSHVILQLSDTATEDDLFKFEGDLEKVEYGDFGPGAGNPGFPASESIYGVKINFAFNQEQISFDSVRQPMWGDFYSKGGASSYAYNRDLGVAVANLHDIDETPVDGDGNPLAKIPVPNTLIPEPATFGLFLVGAFGLLRRRSR